VATGVSPAAQRKTQNGQPGMQFGGRGIRASASSSSQRAKAPNVVVVVLGQVRHVRRAHFLTE